MHSITTTSWLVGTLEQRLEIFFNLFNVRIKSGINKESDFTAVEILEGLDIFPQTIDYWRPPASTSPPPFPIIGLNLHPKLIIGWQGSYGLMCGLKEAIENLPSSLLMLLCIILREGKYYQMKMFAHDVITLAARLATIQMNR